MSSLIPMPTNFLENIPFTGNLSYSQLSTFMDCPLSHFAKYCVRPRAKDSTWLATLLGTAMHAALEFFYRSRMSGEKITDPKVLYDIMGKKLWEEINKNHGCIRYPKSPNQLGSPAAYEAYCRAEQVAKYNIGVTLIDKFLKYYYGSHDHFKPVAIEWKFETMLSPELQAKYRGTTGISFSGVIDLVEQDTRTGVYRIVDHKTSYEFDKTKLLVDYQLSMYALFVREILQLPAKQACYQVFTTNARQLGIEHLYGERDTQHIDRFLSEVNMLIPLMKLPYKPRRHGEHCKFCPISDDCINYKV